MKLDEPPLTRGSTGDWTAQRLLPMRDLITALERINRSKLPDNKRKYLKDTSEIRVALPTAPVILDRIDRLAFDYLFYHRGRLEGKPDEYNIQVLRSEGYDVKLYKDSSDHLGEIQTDKGKIQFG